MIFVLSKADKHAESDIAEAQRFTLNVLKERLGINKPALYVVSGLEVSQSGKPSRDWVRVLDALKSLANESGAALLKAAQARHLKILIDRLQYKLDEELGALSRPITESENRIASLRESISQAKISLHDLSFLLSGEQSRLSGIFQSRKDDFLKDITPKAISEFTAFLQALPPDRGPVLRRKSLTMVQNLAERLLNQWLAEAQRFAEHLYIEATTRFIKMTNDFIEKTKASGGEHLLGPPPRQPRVETGFRARSRLYYTFMLPLTTKAQWDRSSIACAQRK